MDYSLRTAGQTTHLKIVIVALVSATAIVVIGINAKSNDMTSAGLQAGSAVIKAGQPAKMVVQDRLIIR